MTRLLEASTAQAILITAPAGYGKTLLASEWLEGRTDVAWYHATAASADLAAFSIGIVDTMAPIVPGAGDRLRQRLVVGEPPDRAARPTAELLAEDVAAWPDGALLVVDDYHLVAESAPVEEFMDWLLTLAPGLRVLVTSRRRPAWASARRFLHGEIFELTTRQLAMSDGEAAVLLDGRSSESVHRLVAQAQGWPALIALAALSASSEIPDELVTDHLYRYFAEEVLKTQSPELQRLMLRAAVPTSLNSEVARELVGSDEPEALMSRLEDDGLLLPTAPPDYAFHPLLRNFLRRKLEADAPDEFAKLAQTVIAYARAHRRWEEAFELAIYTGALETAAEIIAEASEDLLPAGHIETLETWLEACGAAATRVPARLVRAEVLLRQGRLAEALGLAQETARRLSSDSAYFARVWSLAGQAANLLSQPNDSLQFHLRAVEAAKSPDEATEALWGALVAAAELEVDEFDDYLERFEDAAPEDSTSQLRVVIGRAVSARLKHDVSGSWPLIKSTLPLVPHADPSAGSLFLFCAGYFACLRTEYRLGLALANQATALCRRFRLDFALPASEGLRGHAAFGLRDLSTMRQVVPVLASAAEASGDPFLDAEASLVSARLAIIEGELQRGLAALRRPLLGEPTLSVRGELLATTALIEASLGLADEAEAHISEAISTTSCAETHHIARFAHLIMDLSRDTPSVEEVSDQARALVGQAEDRGLLDALVLAYRVHPPLLRVLAAEERTAAVLRQLCARTNDLRFVTAVGADLGGADPLVGPISNLTRREREVALLICEGLSNKQIADQLVIAESTVKVHVRNIFEKLGVNSRLQAALLARDLLAPP